MSDLKLTPKARRRILELSAGGASQRAVADQLHAEGFPLVSHTAVANVLRASKERQVRKASEPLPVAARGALAQAVRRVLRLLEAGTFKTNEVGLLLAIEMAAGERLSALGAAYDDRAERLQGLLPKTALVRLVLEVGSLFDELSGALAPSDGDDATLDDEEDADGEEAGGTP